MLTQRIDDPDHVESTALTSASGLGLLEARTRFARQKTTSRVVARPSGRGFFAEDVPRDARLGGYEIHMGRLEATDANGAVFEVLERNGKAERSVDGAVGCGGAVVGTMIQDVYKRQTLTGTPDFESGSFGHSDSSPPRNVQAVPRVVKQAC